MYFNFSFHFTLSSIDDLLIAVVGDLFSPSNDPAYIISYYSLSYCLADLFYPILCYLLLLHMHGMTWKHRGVHSCCYSVSPADGSEINFGPPLLENRE